MATCGNDQLIRYETDLEFCMEYNGPERDLIDARDGLIKIIKDGGSLLSTFNDCQKGQPNGKDNYSNGRDCENEHPGISLKLAKKYCHERC